MVGRGDDHGVEVWTIDHFSEVAKLIDRPIDLLSRLRQMRLEHIADRHHLGLFTVEKGRQHLSAPVTYANHADSNPLVRAQHSLCTGGSHAHRGGYP